jgi:PhnB protein
MLSRWQAFRVTSVEPELWVADPRSAIEFYIEAFRARVLYRVGHGDDVVAQLAVDEARFWVSNADARRLDPLQVGGATSRTLLVVADPAAVASRAVAAGAEETSAVTTEHGWQLGRIVDPYGHEWEIGHPMQEWPPLSSSGADLSDNDEE